MTQTARSPYSATYHRDGSVTWWAVYEQRWIRSTALPVREWAARDSLERERLQRHFAQSLASLA